MPSRSSSPRSQGPRDRDDLIAAAPREPWAEAEVTDALGLSPDLAQASASPALDAMAAASLRKCIDLPMMELLDA